MNIIPIVEPIEENHGIKLTINETAYCLLITTCRVPDDQMNYRSYPLLAARELLQQFIREQVHGHQAA